MKIDIFPNLGAPASFRRAAIRRYGSRARPGRPAQRGESLSRPQFQRRRDQIVARELQTAFPLPAHRRRASPLDPYSTENLNAFIKHREGFRKFAASVPQELAGEYFE